jgi:hypothetical protein
MRLGLLFILGAVLSLGIALLSAVAVIHTDTEAWFIGGVFSYVLSVVVASLEAYHPNVSA